MAKTKAQLQAELDELKAKLAEVTAAQQAAKPAPAPEPEPAAPEVTERDGVDFDELVDLLKKEIDDLPAMTALAVFGLGLVTGKLLSE